MPNIYEPVPGKRFEICHPIDHKYFGMLKEIVNGTPRAGEWKPVQMELIAEDRGRPLQESDSPWLGGQSLIFRSRVLSAMGAMLEQYGELLPLECDEAELYIYNPTTVLDALDERNSTIWRFPSGGIMGIRRYAFHADVIREHDIFRISSTNPSLTFLSQRFVERWHAAGLKGLEFDSIWSE